MLSYSGQIQNIFGAARSDKSSGARKNISKLSNTTEKDRYSA